MRGATLNPLSIDCSLLALPRSVSKGDSVLVDTAAVSVRESLFLLTLPQRGEQYRSSCAIGLPGADPGFLKGGGGPGADTGFFTSTPPPWTLSM